jgi:hypothetical protein
MISKSGSTKSMTASAGTIIKPILMLVILAIDIYILVTTLNMQKPEYDCKCAQKWYLKQVSNAIITILSFQILVFLLALFKRVFFSNKMINGFVGLIAIALLIAQLYYIVVMIGLIHQLDKDKCLCVNPNFKTFITYYSGFRALFAIIVLIMFVYAVGMVIRNKMY